MTKKIQTIFLVSFLSLVLMLAIFIPTIFTKDFASASIYDSNLTYDSVEKIIDVSNDKVLDVTEKITVSYKNDYINVGLSRNISKINKITRIWQGKEYVVTTINKFDLKSVKVSQDGLNFEDEYNFITQDEDYYYINIGADGDFKVGTYTYEIKYLYDMGEDFINDFDDFTFDLMDYGFASPVKHFSATVNFPKLFLKDGEKIEDYLSLRQGLYDNISLTDASFSYIENDDNTFSFSCELNDLFATEGLTVQLILPENYFDTSYTPNAWYWVAFSSIFVAVLSVVLVVIVNRKWKTKNVVITPEFYPPKDYSPLDVARTYRGRLKSEDFASLVIYWAGKGYVNLKNNENKIVLTKLKNLPDTDSKSPLFHSKEAEKRYFNAIFEKQEEVVFSENSIASSNIQTAVKELYSVEQEKQNKLLIPRIVIQALSFLPVLFLFLWSFLLGFSSPTSLFIAVFPLISVFVAKKENFRVVNIFHKVARDLSEFGMCRCNPRKQCFYSCFIMFCVINFENIIKHSGKFAAVRFDVFCKLGIQFQQVFFVFKTVDHAVTLVEHLFKFFCLRFAYHRFYIFNKTVKPFSVNAVFIIFCDCTHFIFVTVLHKQFSEFCFCPALSFYIFD